jgi:Holliday junction DNA helicase RuvA
VQILQERCSPVSILQIAQAIAMVMKTIQSVKGIGFKTAQRVILDLRDKILQVLEDPQISVLPSNRGRESVICMETLGYLRKQAQKVVDKVLLISQMPPQNNSLKKHLNNYRI